MLLYLKFILKYAFNELSKDTVATIIAKKVIDQDVAVNITSKAPVPVPIENGKINFGDFFTTLINTLYLLNLSHLQSFELLF